MFALSADFAGSQVTSSCPSFTLKNEPFAGYAAGCNNNVALFHPGIEFQECVSISNIMQESLSTKSDLADVKIGIVNITSQCSNYCLFKVPDNVTGHLNDTGLSFTNADCGDISIAGLGTAAFYAALNIATVCCSAASLIFLEELCTGLGLCVTGSVVDAPSPAPEPQSAFAYSPSIAHIVIFNVVILMYRNI